MRLALKTAINQCKLIDATPSHSVMDGLQSSLDFLLQMAPGRKTVILSDILGAGQHNLASMQHVIAQLKEKQIDKLIGIGESFLAHRSLLASLPIEQRFYPTTKMFIKQVDWSSFNKETILLKGTPTTAFDKIADCLQKKCRLTTMEVDLDAIMHNLRFFRSLLKPNVKTLVMVKAFAYGNGISEIARLLQSHQVDYLGVAHVDEGITLRQDGISIPIMVMNATAKHAAQLLRYDLEPVVYTLSLLRSLADCSKEHTYHIHLNIDTGMHRLGMQEEDFPALQALLRDSPHIRVKSVFSHLAGADEPRHDAFSHSQAEHAQDAIRQLLPLHATAPPLSHLLNSSGIARFPQWQWDMVRLGISLYGADPSHVVQHKLANVATLKTTVLQVKKIPKGATVGYGREGVVHCPTTLAVLAIGYADGFSRTNSQGRGVVLIRGKKAPVLGNVNMDMTVVDVTHIAGVCEGDEAQLFGAHMPIQEVAARIGTIPYEILTSVGERVERVFYANRPDSDSFSHTQ